MPICMFMVIWSLQLLLMSSIVVATAKIIRTFNLWLICMYVYIYIYTSIGSPPSASFHCYGTLLTTFPRRHFYDGVSAINNSGRYRDAGIMHASSHCFWHGESNAYIVSQQKLDATCHMPHGCRVNHAWKSVYVLRKTKMADGHFLVFRHALLSWSILAHVTPSRTLYNRCSKTLWRFRCDLVACMRGVCGQPFSTPLYIYRYRYVITRCTSL